MGVERVRVLIEGGWNEENRKGYCTFKVRSDMLYPKLKLLKESFIFLQYPRLLRQ